MTIITTKKPFEEVLGALKNVNKIGLVSCGSCAAMCQTGGTEGAKEMAEKLEQEGFEVVVTIVPEEVCDNRVMMKDIRKIDKDLGEIDAILTLSCGLGVASITQVLSKKHPEIPVFIGTNTEFMGMTERIGRFYQRCRGCGDCLLNETGGICPITTCAKSLMNGPCGGMVRGKCEVGNYEKDCGWVLIFNRLKELGRLDLFTKLRDPVDWSESGHQREVVWR
ncbi:MAG: methylenetetrahydrofolate reductase C-terminal domain-containing protein [Candidatus Thorarchaeota archaeon]